ncbi:hypothetical protein M406DRAFT_355971 [Cryphonectria parasitica EP155]|uniref:Uncharacterized protein n=1 Tax=Cryphonectria parasitica (strain ATCC 38755 / EP155) TaxID=660469 RepID=A0A9P4Y235_CRYP1|nr:uncharacterized protein M406DRAFT_355971 [Cryphonectria parasitica EP155]KAF3765562.1 hypothetical protein M406DRAFT_355971 [Cryphonectria parasitica EP155]
MDFVTKIKDAVVPDANTIPQTQSAEPENEIPGAFPDADDETLGRQLEGDNTDTTETTQGHTDQDSAVDVDERSPLKGRDTALPDSAPVAPASGAVGDVNTSSDSGSHFNVGTGSSADGMTSIEEVKPHHLGNEGKVLGATGSSEVGTGSGSSGALAPARDTRSQDPSEEYGNSAPAAAVEPTSSAHEGGSSAAGLGDSALESARPQAQQEDNTGFAAGTGGGTHERVLEAASDLNRGAPQPPRDAEPEAAAALAETAARFSGGIHNGVSGAGSDDPLGERSGSPHERSTQYRKGDVQNVISGVSQSGLGQGGIHNGVVGLGSQEEEAIRRHSLDNQGQKEEGEAQL